MDPHHRSGSPPSNPLYPSIDQYQQPQPGQQHVRQQVQHAPGDQGYSPNFNQNFNYQQNNNPSFYNMNVPPQQAAGNQGNFQQPFNDLGFISNVALGPMGATMLHQANQYVGSRMGQYMNLGPLKYYFNVNNSYVFNKIKLLLCPFLHKSWKRRIGRYNEVDSYVPPREDINAPDLYIPVMSYVTYILLIGIVLGTNLKFTPEVLGVTASTGFLALAFEVLLMKTGCYLLNCGNIAVSDLIAYCGYKFVGIVVSILAGLLGGTYAYYAAIVYIGLSMAIFMVRTLRIVLTLEQGGVGNNMGNVMQGGFSGPGMGMGPGNAMGMVPGTSDRGMTRNYFLLVVGVLQVLLVYLLSVRA